MTKYLVLSSMNSFAGLSGNAYLIASVAILTFSVLICDMVKAAIKARRMCK
jgi:hypothetical protein